jgi:hypothetical protein
VSFDLSSWTAIVRPSLLALLILWLPGSGILLAGGLRGPAVVALAPVLSAGIVSVSAVIFPAIGIRWGLFAVACVAVLSVLVVFGTRWLLSHRFNISRVPPPAHVWKEFLLGCVIGAAVVGMTLLRIIGRPENFAQRYDNVFHLNAVRYIADTGNGSSFWLGSMINGADAPGFYPAGWHDLASLIFMTAGTSVPAAVNVLTITVCAGVWVSGGVWLAGVLTGYRRWAQVSAGVLSGALTGFPFLFLEWGTLYPNLLSLSFMPAILSLLTVFGDALSDTRWQEALEAAMLLIFAVPGVVLSHPNALLFSILAGTIVVVQVLFKGNRRTRGRRRVIYTVAALFVVALFLLIWWKIRTPLDANTDWRGYETSAQAVGEWLMSAPVKHVTLWLAGAFTLVGAWWLWCHGRSVVVIWWLSGGVLFVAAANANTSLLREFLTGGFYRDPYRLAALAAVTTLPVASVGLMQVLELAESWFRSRSGQRWLGEAISTLTIVVAMGGTQYSLQNTAARTIPFFRYTESSEVLTGDEYQTLLAVANIVPEQDTLIVNPGTGASFAYALSGRRVSEFHILGGEHLQNSVTTFREDLNQIDEDQTVCRYIREENAYYVLDFGDGNVPLTHYSDEYPGFSGLEEPDFETVYQRGEVRILKVEACE